jgi:gliding motility-associated-like protein
MSTPNSCSTYYRTLGSGQYEQITLTQGVTYSFDLSSAYLPNSSWSEHSVFWGGGVCINGTSNGNSVIYTAPATGNYNIGTNRITNGDWRYYFNYQSATLAYSPLQPNQPGGISGLTTVCSGSTATYSIGAASYAKDYAWEYSTDNGNSYQPYTYSGSTSINLTWPSVGNANGYIRVKSQNGPCSSAWTYLYVGILEQPTAPTTTTKSPNNNQVCINQQVGISAATGGVNQGCTIEYRHTIDGGNTWSAPYTTVPSGLSSSVSGNNRIQIQARRNSCTTSGCNTTSWNTIAMWHVDITPPTVLVHNVIVNLNAAGTYTLLPAVVDNGTTDNCTISTMTVSPSLFNCSNVGPNNVVLTVTDNAGNISTGNAVVTVKDVTPPNISVQNIFLALDMNGLGSITPAMINNGTTDACGIDTMYLSQYNFDCSHVGSNTVTLTVIDVNGNTSTSTATVLVQDLINPVVVTQDITVHLNANGVANITPPMIDGGSSDNCSYTLFTIPSTFNCANVGENTILVLAVDPGNNVVFNSAVVTVVDSIKPTITAPANLTVNANGSCVATGVQLGTPVTADNCSIATLTNNAPSSFPLGTTTVTWTVTDVNGNTRTATQTVTVVDVTDPIVSLPPLVTVNANANCGALNTSINFGLITNDNCTIASVVNNGPTTFPLGYSSIIWTITDNSGNSIQANQSVRVVDNTPPTITTPPTVTVNANASCTATNVILGTPVTADNCQVVTVINNAPTSYSVGTTPVTWTVIDAAGNVTTAIQNVIVNDVTAPIISCPAAVINKNNTPGVCGYIVQGTEFNPTAADNCNQATITHNYSSWSSNTSLAGATLPVGTTVITWTATDIAGNTSTCTETITVVDNQAPTMVNCASGLTLTIGQYSCGSNPNWSAPQATDNCGVVSLTQTSGPSSTAVLAVGSYTVVYTALDAAGNSATCSFTINVINSTAPIVVCPNNITNQSTNSNNCVWTSGTQVNPIQAMGNCISLTWSITNPGGSINTGTNNVAGYNFQKGTSILTYTVTDNINVTATCSTQITVIDNTLPSITAPTNITTPSNSSCQATGLSLGTPITGDNCSVTSVTNNAPSSFPLGITTITWTVTDGSGNIKTATQTVTVIDNQGPVINCPSSPINRNNSAGTCEYTAVGNEFNISATDNCTLTSLTHNYQASASNTSLAGSVFPVGTTNVIWTATDASGNVSTCTVAIHVVDNEAPTFNSCPSDISVGVYSNCGNGPTWTVPTAADNCSTATVTQTSGPAPGANLNPGTYTVTYQAVDASNNTVTCSFVITVINSSNPIIVCPASVTQNTTIPTGCDWISSANSLTPVMAAGNCPFNITWSVMNSAGSITTGINDASGFNFYAGTNVLTYTITDASNNAVSCTTNVIVIEDVNPTIVPPTDVTESIVNGCTISAVNLGTPVAFDNCAIDTITNNAPATFALGTTVVTWTVTDISGNSSTATQNVTIVDLILPTITAPANVTAYANTNCIATGVVLGTPVTADNCSVASITNDAPATFALGTTTVTWTVTDGSGNVKTATQTVTVIDNTNPTITPPTNVIVNANSACAAFNVALGTPVTADNCSIAQLTNNAPTVFPLGTTTVTWTVKDGSGNTTTATQTVTVNDVVLPTIVPPANLAVTTNTGCTATGVVLGNPITADNCSVATVTNNAPVAFPLGNTTVTWTVTDGSGNVKTATQLVTVTDVTLPTITAPANITLNANASCVATGVALGTPVTADNCTVASVTNNAPATFALGTTTITWTVTDGSGNVKTATQTVTVVDNVNPTITAPLALIVNTNNGCSAFNVALGLPVTFDNCSIASISNDAPNIFPLGNTTVTWIITDAAGNSASATQIVTVVDNIAPVIFAPTDIITYSNANCQVDNLVLGTPVTSDNCSIASITNNAPAIFNYGTTTVTWTIVDGSGNVSTATQLVSVYDSIKPTAVLNDYTITLSPNGPVAITVADVDNGSFDNCGIASIVLSQYAFDCSNLGQTEVFVTITDIHGNKTESSVIVTSLLSGIDDDFDGIDDACDESVNTTTVEVPDGFTPDGDNINDLFVIPGMDNYSKVEIEIFNRYGNSVYKNPAYQNDWNGTSSVDGLTLQDDTYFYVLILDGSLTKQGFVYINRVH